VHADEGQRRVSEAGKLNTKGNKGRRTTVGRKGKENKGTEKGKPRDNRENGSPSLKKRIYVELRSFEVKKLRGEIKASEGRGSREEVGHHLQEGTRDKLRDAAVGSLPRGG